MLWSIVMRLDPRDGGLTMISPLAMLVIGMFFVAIAHTLIGGTVINILWERFNESLGDTIKYSYTLAALVTAGLLLFSLINVIVHLGAEYTLNDLGGLLPEFVIISTVFALANLLSVLATNKLTNNKPLA
jgi:hypothetical protein